MKEAAGEANMTVITIVLIAIVLAVGTVVVRSVLNNTSKSSKCSNAGGVWQKNACYNPTSCDSSGNCTTTISY